MAANGFDTHELDAFMKDLLSLTNDKMPKESRKFLNKEGNKLKKQQKKNFKSKGIGTGQVKSKEVEKSFKRGKIYKYKGKNLSVRSYSAHPLAHLLNNGHRIVDKNGEEKGFVLGYHFMEDAQKDFEGEYVDDCEQFIDDMLNKGL